MKFDANHRLGHTLTDADRNAILVPDGSNLGILHLGAALLVDRYLEEPDPCVAVCLSRQFRLISEDADVPDAQLRVLYRTLAARWHQMAIKSVFSVRPSAPWLDEFAPELRG